MKTAPHNDDCLICSRIDLIKRKDNPFFVKELQTGYVVLGDHQSYRGYTVFLSKIHASELHELELKVKELYLIEMAGVAQAVYLAFRPDKLNYELLGNTDRHLHWHIFPRRKQDPKAFTAIWALDKSERSYVPTVEERDEYKTTLLRELNKIFI